MAEQPGLGEPVPVGVIDVAHATVGVMEATQPNLARQIKSVRNDIRRLKAEVEAFSSGKAEKAAAAAARRVVRPVWYYPAVAVAGLAGIAAVLRARVPALRLF